jgi:hypothetical protein
MLREHAFDSGSLFTQTLETDQRDLLAEVARDYWRLHCYHLHGSALAWVQSGWGQPDALLAQARRLFDPTAAAPATELQALLEQVLNQRDAELAALKVPCVQWADELEALLDQAVEQGVVDKRKIQKRYYAPWFETLRQWALTPEQIKLELPPGPGPGSAKTASARPGRRALYPITRRCAACRNCARRWLRCLTRTAMLCAMRRTGCRCALRRKSAAVRKWASMTC